MAPDDFSVPTAVQPDVRPPRRWRVSWVWSVPVLAALVGLSLLYKTVIDRGPSIVVTFQAATGIEAGKTRVKVKDVEIGQVTAVHLAPDRSHVEVMIELAKEARSFTARDSRFWVVRPRFAGSGISGLETLMSGAYIAAEGGRASDTAERFTGLETPPVIATDLPGRRFQLEAEDSGSLDVGAPVFFRRLPVGQVEGVVLNPRGRGVSIGIFVHAPYDRFVTVGTRFWHASGIDFSLDARGLRVDTQSLAAILMGGIAFETPDDPGADDFISEGASFPLSRNRSSALEPVHEGAFSVLMRFNQSVRGLEVGAPLDLRGVEVGRVKAIRLVYEPRSRDFVPVVEGEIYPDQLETLAGGARDLLAHGTESLAQQIDHGLRAQLRSDSLLTGKLFVAVDFFPDAPPGGLRSQGRPAGTAHGQGRHAGDHPADSSRAAQGQ
ncbi:intermembrane transport protein PqiB [Pararhodospirillum photometricum]|uniref:Paraquat-inducible protein B n=1 Tax=Pararhodospirillum photometricum DSM 122 TaxID=1150469 RepID=H6SP92_PARPM|nr:MlaD family protein [Pararhodospirillum photometricum]CCG09417.1 Paraquat-inducible protein B [Pararhodospirillum photometricum DSM 122]